VRAAAVLLLLGLLLHPVPAHADAEPVLTFADGRIRESSGLVDLGDLMVTVNDSGDTGRVFTVDPRSGETVGVTDYGADAVDVESLAPAGRRSVWVGDIGDNTRSRDEVTVHRVPVGRGDVQVESPVGYRLVYPDGSHDAESLLATPSGRLYVITKAVMGGSVYRAPATLRRSATNRLEKVGEVVDFATDAALVRGGRFAIVRGPRQASVYTFPAFARVGTFALPRQPQGEGISVGPDGRIRLSTEGVGSRVLQVPLPREIARAMRAPSPPTAAPSPRTGGGESDASTPNSWLAWSVAGAVVLAAVGVALGLGRRGA
jgi:hypothetical protein